MDIQVGCSELSTVTSQMISDFPTVSVKNLYPHQPQDNVGLQPHHQSPHCPQQKRREGIKDTWGKLKNLLKSNRAKKHMYQKVGWNGTC